MNRTVLNGYVPNRYVLVAGVAAAQLALTATAVAPQLSARVTGESYLVRVELYDPIDPFRGAYVALAYPDLPATRDAEQTPELPDLEGPEGRVFVSLTERDGVYVATDWSRERPEEGVFLSCSDGSWSLRCGIESWFVPQDEAAELERELMDSGGIAELRIDSRGNAAIVDLKARG